VDTDASRSRSGRGSAGGISLIELMIVLVIMAVLLAVAMPAYRGQVLKTRRSLARAELLALAVRQEQFFVNHKAYATDLTDLGFADSPYGIDAEGNTVAPDDPERVYLIAIDSSLSPYSLSATPQLRQSDDRLCGTLSLDLRGIKGVSGTGSVAQCW
jgi:type IV pilus assembly protein PilE